MNLDERTMMIIAMETIARRLNDESIVYNIWLSYGIPDGDIDVFNDTYENIKAYVYDNYDNDEDYADLMDTFLLMMHKATERYNYMGALYSDGIRSESI